MYEILFPIFLTSEFSLNGKKKFGNNETNNELDIAVMDFLENIWKEEYSIKAQYYKLISC